MTRASRPLGAPPPPDAMNGDLDAAADLLRERCQTVLRRSLHIRTVDTGSCGACESEIRLLSSPYYDFHRLGLFFTPTPRHADCLLVTGPGSRAMDHALLSAYQAMPAPKVVVAVGACPLGGVFGADRYTRGVITDLVPVDVVVPGCPPSPLALIHGLLLALGRIEERINLPGGES
ncbi:MAG: NADH-quinone oxidoreductase subunit B family protein [Candidatus Dormibacteria bacterium]